MPDLASRPLLLPTGDPTPVEKAAVDSILDGHEPETFLWINFHRPDGGVRIWYAWTAGGTELGNRIDQIALPAGFDASDWLHIGDLHCTQSNRGRIAIQAYALRPILGDVQSGVRGPQDRRDGIVRIIARAAAETGQAAPSACPRWLGFGPVLLSRKTA